MFTLADYNKSDFLQRSYRCQVVNSRQLWHVLS
jgi:hypothetical protein